MRLKKPIGILGGTFDPIHFGHLRFALELLTACDLAYIKLIPCYHPVHRATPVASPNERLIMVKKAIVSEPSLKIDDREIRWQNRSYTIDTIESLRVELPNTPLCFLMGIDALSGFTSWQRHKDILKQAHLIVAHRPYYQLPKTGALAKLLKQHLTHDVTDLHQHLAGKILLHPVTALEISASDIRRQIADNENPRFLLPENVYQYILKNKIYRKKHANKKSRKTRR